MQICWKNGFADQWLSPRNSGAKYDSNKMLRWFQNFSVCLSNVLAKIPAKDSRDTLAYYVRNDFDMPQHFAKDYEFFKLYKWYLIAYNTRERVKRKTLFLLLITLFWFLHVSLLSQKNTLPDARKTWCSKYSSVWKTRYKAWIEWTLKIN